MVSPFFLSYRNLCLLYDKNFRQDAHIDVDRAGKTITKQWGGRIEELIVA